MQPQQPPQADAALEAALKRIVQGSFLSEVERGLVAADESEAFAEYRRRRGVVRDPAELALASSLIVGHKTRAGRT